MSAVKSSADTEAVSVALHSVYGPWLEAAALHFQKLAAKHSLPDHATQDADQVAVPNGGAVLFADGLRFDVSQRLAERLRQDGRSVSMTTRWAGLPTVTATAKHAVSPVASEISGATLGDDFWPDVAADGRQLSTDRFRKLLDGAGYQFLRQDQTGDPAGKAWTEDGNLDKQGHSLQGKLAGHVEDQLGLLLERIDGLLDAGWQEVCVVTDHGWLLLPGGLPKVSLPKYLTQTRWSRCASIKGESRVTMPTVGWHWNPSERVAVGPGIACFTAGNEYAHGGVSLQECLLPVLRVGSGKRASPAAMIAAIGWAGLRCRVQVDGAAPGTRVDLRTNVGAPGSSVSGERPVDDQGAASLLVADDDLEGSSAVLVVLDADGKVTARKATIIGGGGEE